MHNSNDHIPTIRWYHLGGIVLGWVLALVVGAITDSLRPIPVQGTTAGTILGMGLGGLATALVVKRFHKMLSSIHILCIALAWGIGEFLRGMLFSPFVRVDDYGRPVHGVPPHYVSGYTLSDVTRESLCGSVPWVIGGIVLAVVLILTQARLRRWGWVVVLGWWLSGLFPSLIHVALVELSPYVQHRVSWAQPVAIGLVVVSFICPVAGGLATLVVLRESGDG